MKKLIAILLALATLSACAVSLAEEAAAAPAEETTTAAQEQQTSAAAKTPGHRTQTRGSKKTEKSPIDFDEMVSKGVISQETCDRIKAALAAQKPAGKTEKAAEETVEESTEASTEKTETKTERHTKGKTKAQSADQSTDQTTAKPAKTRTAPWERLLTKLLKADVITQAEYDALAAAMNP